MSSRRIAELTDAIISVWVDVLQIESLGPHDKLGPLCVDAEKVGIAVALTNQWLQTKLTLREILAEGSPAALAFSLYAQGYRAPHTDTDVATRDTTGSGSPSPSHWGVVWDSMYRFSRSSGDDDFNSAGWFDRKTLTAISDSVMQEWVQATVARVTELNPSAILDVGCGAGLLLFRLMDECDRYVGVDYSGEAVSRIKRALASRSGACDTHVIKTEALEVGDAVDGKFDVILMNSVIQYFPNVDYLRMTLEGLSALRTPSGSIFLGDVLNGDLNRALHLYHAIERSPGRASVGQILRTARLSAEADDVLTASPRELRALTRSVDPDLTCRSLIRRGVESTPMNRFRYDSLISSHHSTVKSGPDRIFEWQAIRQVPMSEVISSFLMPEQQSLVVRAAPDSRSFPFVRLADALDGAPTSTSLEEVREKLTPISMVNTEEVWDVGHRLGFGVAVSPCRQPGFVDLAFVRDGTDWEAASLL